jgi:hypothetical protein
MQITEQAVKERVAALQQKAEKLRSELSATIGALQDCGFWLATLAEPEPEELKP